MSIVVPARNEVSAIGKAVSSFCNQDYEGFEVIVVDDQFTDQTPDILRNLRSEHANLTVIAGTWPPEGWLGKTNALEIGQRPAKGGWILFVDADAVYVPDLLCRATAYVLEQDAAVLALWPRYRTEGVLKAIIMSLPYLVSSPLSRCLWLPDRGVGGLRPAAECSTSFGGARSRIAQHLKASETRSSTTLRWVTTSKEPATPSQSRRP